MSLRLVPRPPGAVCCVHPNCPVHPYLLQHTPTRHCALCALRSAPYPPKRLGACALPGDSSTPTPCALCAVFNAHSEKCSWTAPWPQLPPRPQCVAMWRIVCQASSAGDCSIASVHTGHSVPGGAPMSPGSVYVHSVYIHIFLHYVDISCIA